MTFEDVKKYFLNMMAHCLQWQGKKKKLMRTINC